MKYEIVGIEHAVGDFTPTSGRNANTVQHYDVYRLHTLKYSKDAAVTLPMFPVTFWTWKSVTASEKSI